MRETVLTVLGRFWDWIDARDIDKHAVSIFIMSGTWHVTAWAMAFAENHDTMSGIEMAAVIGAVVGPYSLLQGAAIKFYFDSRDKT